MRSRFPLALAAVLLVFGLAHHVEAQAAGQTTPPQIDPLRFAAEIEAFEATDKLSPPPKGAIVLTGSSTVRRWHPTLEKDLAPLTVIPRGFGGSVMTDIFVEDDLHLNPKGYEIWSAAVRQVLLPAERKHEGKD